MKGFFEKLNPKGKGNKNGGGNRLGDGSGNPFQKLKLPGQQPKFKGQGQSLGGSKPGKVIQITFTEPGALGLKVEKRPNSQGTYNQGTCIVSSVVPNGQSDRLGLQRGDILCYAGSNGEEEIMYEHFLEMAKSDQRPLYFEVRRISTKSGNTETLSGTTADAFSKKQAVIAAAEAREKARKAKMKPIPKVKKDLPTMMSRADKHKLDAEREQQRLLDEQNSTAYKSEESRIAMEIAKANEVKLAAQLGYNPYETSKSNSNQARNATVTENHGAISATKDNNASIPQVQPPSNPTRPLSDEHNNDQSTNNDTSRINQEFDEIFSVIVSSNNGSISSIISSLSIMRKLIVNATTKGQKESNDDSASKFRRVRLSNAKIKAAVVDVHGAIDLMMLSGFQITEEGSESFLIFPLGYMGPNWLPQALRRMEQYEIANK